MTYTLESPDNLILNVAGDAYAPPSDPLAVPLHFLDDVESHPPLPWRDPRLVVEYTAPLGTAIGRQGLTTITSSAATPANDERSIPSTRAAAADLRLGAPFEDSDPVDSRAGLLWGESGPAHSDHSSPWRQSIARDTDKVAAWGRGQDKDRPNYVGGWIMVTPFQDATVGQRWYSVNLTGTPYPPVDFFVNYLQDDTATTITLDGGSEPHAPSASPEVVLNTLTQPPEASDRPSVPDDVSTRLTARQATPRDNGRRLPWGPGQSMWHDYNLPYPVEPNEDPDPDEPPDPPEIKKVYLIMNTLQIADVATSTPLDIRDVSISLDLDSLSWQFSGTVYGQGTLDLVRPDENGMKDVTVTINSHTWVFTIERYSSDERFPTQKFGISGVSRTQYMAAPFAPTRSYTNDTSTTAAQAATAELNNTGFTLDWPTGSDGDLPDWTLPVEALSYRDKSPAQVVAMIVKAAGGVMIPKMGADEWLIQQRYTTPPWDWDTVTPDAIAYVGQIRSRSAKYEPAQEHNACFVSGVNQGVSVDVQRDGSGGTDPMPDIFEELITDSQPAISRGRNELAAVGNKVVEQIELPIPENGGAPGVVVPGQILQVQHDDSAQDYVGLVLSTSIRVARAGAAEIFQSITLERKA